MNYDKAQTASVFECFKADANLQRGNQLMTYPGVSQGNWVIAAFFFFRTALFPLSSIAVLHCTSSALFKPNQKSLHMHQSSLWLHSSSVFHSQSTAPLRGLILSNSPI